MAFDMTSLLFRSGLRGVVFDDTAAASDTEPLVGWDTTSQKIYIHWVKLGCACGRLTLFDGSGGSMICSLVEVSGASGGYTVEEWNFRGDPVQCDGTSNICVSASGVIHGMVKFELGV